jgi:hypothetical protein
MLRRDILRAIAGTACVSVSGTLSFPALANLPSAGSRESLAAKLAPALRTVGGEVCMNAAQRLENLHRDGRPISLHLRRAGLNMSGALMIARALQSLSASEAALLRSFSVSYNPDMEDGGAIALAQSMPGNIRDVGLVGCGLSDAGGAALLEWADSAVGLQMICVEENRFSDQLRKQFVLLREENSSLVVFV